MKNEEQVTRELEIDVKLHEFIILTQDLLSDLIQEGEPCHSIFNSQAIPTIQLGAYLRRIHKYTRFSPECLIMAILYFDRYNLAVKDFSLTWHNVHRIYLTCLVIAVKFHDDVYFDNLAFEKGGGVPVSQLFAFQLQIFQKIDFNAYIDPKDYEQLLDKMYAVYGVDQES